MSVSLIAGTDPLLGRHLAAQLVARRDGPVCWVADDGRAAEAWRDQRPVSGSVTNGFCERLRIVSTSELYPLERTGDLGDVSGADVWMLCGPPAPGTFDPWRRVEGVAATVLRAARPRRVNWVVRAGFPPDGVGLPALSAPAVSRVFHTPWLIDPDRIDGDPPDDLMTMVEPVDDVVHEVRARLASFFEWQSLKLRARPEAILRFVSVRAAVEAMIAVAKIEDRPVAEYEIAASGAISVADLCERIGDSYDLTMSPVGAAPVSGALDRLLADRLGPRHAMVSSLADEQPHAARRRVDTAVMTIDPDAFARVVDAARADGEQRRRRRDRRARAAIEGLEPRTVAVAGGVLTYFAAGRSGPPLLLLNALGQGLEFWSRLIPLLAERHRAFIWEPRSTTVDDAIARLDDQVADVEAVFANERIDTCCLVGWCTGPQVALQFHRRFAHAVRGLVFLNCSLTVPGASELNTPYSDNLEHLCRMVVAEPRLAGSVMQSLSAAAADPEALLSLTGEALADAVLQLTTVDLRRHVVKPFQSADSMRCYAAQIVDLLSHDTLSQASAADAPALVVGCAYDRIASPDAVRALAARMPRARYVELPGTHYALYEQPEHVASLIAAFTDDVFAADAVAVAP